MHFDEEQVQWHFQVWEWLLRNFGGIEGLRKRQLVTPTQEFFPFRPRFEQAYFDEVFQSVRARMGLAAWPCELEPLEDAIAAQQINRQHAQGEWSTGGAAGTFQWREEGVIIHYSPNKIDEPIALVATMVHELCHYLLATAETHPPGGWEEHELHTDIACSFMGFGIFACNSTFNFQQWGDAFKSGWKHSSQGYLSESENAYNLALFTQLNGADPKIVEPFLKPNPRAYFNLALEDLEHRQGELSKLRRIVTEPTLIFRPRSAILEPVQEKAAPEAATLTLEEVRSLTFRNLANEPVWDFFYHFVQQQEGTEWHACEFAALDQLPPLLRDLVLVVRFMLTQEHHGLQGGILLETEDAIADSEKMLDLTINAFETFRDDGHARFLRALMPGIRKHLDDFDRLSAEDRLEEFMSPLDQDDHWSALANDYHHEIRRQIDWHPQKFVFPPVS